MYKILIIFIAGVIETFLFTWWNLSANKKQVYTSSILMFVYMAMYLMILNYAFKDVNSKLMIMSYVVGCTLGNYIRVRQENQKNNKNKLFKKFIKWLRK